LMSMLRILRNRRSTTSEYQKLFTDAGLKHLKASPTTLVSFRGSARLRVTFRLTEHQPSCRIEQSYAARVTRIAGVGDQGKIPSYCELHVVCIIINSKSGTARGLCHGREPRPRRRE
jgi:hypothetical protein